MEIHLTLFTDEEVRQVDLYFWTSLSNNELGISALLPTFTITEYFLESSNLDLLFRNGTLLPAFFMEIRLPNSYF